MGRRSMFKNEIVEALHDKPNGLRCLELFGLINKNRKAALDRIVEDQKIPLKVREKEKTKLRNMSANTLQKYLEILAAEGGVTKTVLAHKKVVYKLDPEIRIAEYQLHTAIADLFAFLRWGRGEGAIDDETWEASRDDATKLLGNMATAELPKMRDFLQVVVRAIDRYQNDQKYQKNGQP